MKKLIYLLLTVALASCEKKEKPGIMKVQINGTDYGYTVSSKSAGSTTSAVLFNSQSANQQTVHEFTPEVGKVINVKVKSNNAAFMSVTMSYKSVDYDFLNCNTGTTANPCSFDKDYPIPKW